MQGNDCVGAWDVRRDIRIRGRLPRCPQMGLHPGAQPSLILRCEGCEQIFCFECDQVIHGTLHNCPGCVLAAGRA